MHHEERMKNNELRYDSFTNDADSVTATIEDKGSKQNVSVVINLNTMYA